MNIQSAEFIDASRMNVKVISDEGELILQRGSKQWDQLLDDGWDEEKIIDATANSRRQQAKVWFDRIDQLARQDVKYYQHVDKLRKELEAFEEDTIEYMQYHTQSILQDIDAVREQHLKDTYETIEETYSEINEVNRQYHDMYYKAEEEKRRLEEILLYNHALEKKLTDKALEQANLKIVEASQSIEAVSLKNDEQLLTNILQFINKYNSNPKMIDRIKQLAKSSPKYDEQLEDCDNILDILKALNG